MAILFQLNIFLFGVIFLNHIHGLASTSKEIDGKYYSFPADKKGQHQASSACSKDGGKLYEPRNKSNYLKVMNEAGFNNIWLGINDVAQEGKFIYQSDNSELLLNDYWAFKLKYNGDIYDCILGSRIHSYKLYNQNCGYPENYVCEFNGEGKSTKLLVPENDYGKSLEKYGFDSWKQIDDKYYSFNKVLQTQDNAKAACNRNGGNLYEPKSKTTYNKIISYAKSISLGDYWLGINDKSQEGMFVYESNDELPIHDNVTDWVNGEPSYTDKEKNCVFNKRYIVTSNTQDQSWYQWINQHCGYFMNYVCEKNKEGKSLKHIRISLNIFIQKPFI